MQITLLLLTTVQLHTSAEAEYKFSLSPAVIRKYTPFHTPFFHRKARCQLILCMKGRGRCLAIIRDSSGSDM